MEGKRGDRETSHMAIAAGQVKEAGGLKQGGSRRSGDRVVAVDRFEIYSGDKNLWIFMAN